MVKEVILHNSKVNPKLQPDILSLEALNIYLNLHFPSNREAGLKVGLSSDRVRQIRIGYKLPKTAMMINRLADGWNIDRTKLALLFERCRREND